MPQSPKPNLPFKLRILTSLLNFIINLSRNFDGTLNRRFFSLFDRTLPPNPTPINGVTTSDITVDSTRHLWFRLFTPSTTVTTTTLPVVVFFHGGGFMLFSPASSIYDAVCRLFCKSFNAVIVSVNYRLGPEHRYPSQYDDAFDVLKFLDRNGDVLGKVADVEKLFLAGDSCGGNIAHHVAVRVCKEKLRFVRVIGLISIEPFFGGEERTESEIRMKHDPLTSLEKTDWYWKAFLPDGLCRDHEAVNVSGPNKVDISGLDYPNTVVVIAGFDPLQDWQRRYSEWLRESGKEVQVIEYPNMIHGFHVFPDLPDTCRFLQDVKDFIDKQVASVS